MDFFLDLVAVEEAWVKAEEGASGDSFLAMVLVDFQGDFVFLKVGEEFR